MIPHPIQLLIVVLVNVLIGWALVNGHWTMRTIKRPVRARFLELWVWVMIVDISLFIAIMMLGTKEGFILIIVFLILLVIGWIRIEFP